jgi:hypothetical protein
MTTLQQDAYFADIAMLAVKAEAMHKAKPTLTRFNRWHRLAREYSRLLRERLDAKNAQRNSS